MNIKVSKILIMIFFLVNLLMINIACTKEKKIINDNSIVYRDIKYGNHKRQRLDIALPKNQTDNIGLILMIHGGGWIAGDKDGCYNEMIDWAENEGIACAAINYHYASKKYNINDILNDVTKSLNKIKEIGKENNLNINKVMLYGGSAGAHISLLYGYKNQNISPIEIASIVSLAGPSNLEDENYYKDDNPHLEDVINMISLMCGYKFNQNTISKAKEYLYKSSPINYINENSVPTIICHGTKDDVVPFTNAVILEEILTKNKVENELIIFEGSGHGLENNNETLEYAKNKIKEYVKKYLN